MRGVVERRRPTPWSAQFADAFRCWSQGREGVVIVKTKQAILITHYPETIQPGTAANTGEKLGAYLVGVGY